MTLCESGATAPGPALEAVAGHVAVMWAAGGRVWAGRCSCSLQQVTVGLLRDSWWEDGWGRGE